MRLTLLIIILHILQRRKSRLDREIEPFVAGIGNGFAHGRADDVGFSVLFPLLVSFDEYREKLPGVVVCIP